MPLVLGLASSHAPSMFVGAEHWPEVYRGLAGKAPAPPELAQETPAVLEDYARRVTQGFAALRAQLEAAKPDALFIIGDDQNELFSKALIPSFAMFMGDAAEGTTAITWIGEKVQDKRITLPCHAAIAKIALAGLVERGFDLGFVEKMTPLARPEIGLGHAFTRIGHGDASGRERHSDHPDLHQRLSPAAAERRTLLRAGPGAARCFRQPARARRDLRLRRAVARSARPARR